MTRPLRTVSSLLTSTGLAFGARVADMTGTVFTQDRQPQQGSPITVPLAIAILMIILWLCSDRGLRSLKGAFAAIRTGERVS